MALQEDMQKLRAEKLGLSGGRVTGDVIVDGAITASKGAFKGDMSCAGELTGQTLQVTGHVSCGTLDVLRHLASPEWNVSLVMQEVAGPLSKEGKPFTSQGGSLIVLASGSAYAYEGRKNLWIGIHVLFNGTPLAKSLLWANEGNSHKALPSIFAFIPRPPAAQHTISLVPHSGTETDQNDQFNVTVIELPI